MNKSIRASMLSISIAILTQCSYASEITEEVPYTLNYAGGPDTTDWLEGHDGVVLSYLQAEHILPETIPEKCVLEIDFGCTASNCSRVLAVKDAAGKEYIIKEIAGSYSKDPDSPFMREKILAEKNGSLDQYNSLMKLYIEKTGKCLPILSTYQAVTAVEVAGEMLPLVVMSKVKGKSLKDLTELFCDVDLNQDSEFVSQSIEMGRNIGEQMGQMSRAFMLEDKSILRHNDPNVNNFFYDEITGQFSWIDLPDLYTSAYEKKENGSIYSDEEYMINTIWRAFFPFQEDYDFLQSWDSVTGSARNFKELVEKQGVEVLAHHRIGILTANAFIKAYVEQVKDLDYYLSAIAKDDLFKEMSPPNGDDFFNDFFMDKIEELKGEYEKEIRKAFGESSEGVLDYLFSRQVSNSHEVSEEEITNLDINGIVANLQEKMRDDARYDHIHPIYTALRSADSSYNSYGLGQRRNYKVNIGILKKEYIQKRLKTTIKALVEQKLSDQKYTEEELNLISDLLYLNEYSKLLAAQYQQYNGGYKRWYKIN